MARRLQGAARLVGRGSVEGRLYRVADYPGFVPGTGGVVHGDLFRLADPAATLAMLDEYEECTPRFPRPWEYGRVRVSVQTQEGVVEAWIYAYAHDTAGLDLVDSGDFLA